MADSEQQQTNTEEGNETMHVKVHAPYKTYFDDEAVSLTAENDTGQFDILPKHHRFISLLSPCEIVVRKPDSSEEKIKIQQGIMHVKSNEVVVFLDV